MRWITELQLKYWIRESTKQRCKQIKINFQVILKRFWKFFHIVRTFICWKKCENQISNTFIIKLFSCILFLTVPTNVFNRTSLAHELNHFFAISSHEHKYQREMWRSKKRQDERWNCKIKMLNTFFHFSSKALKSASSEKFSEWINFL